MALSRVRKLYLKIPYYRLEYGQWISWQEYTNSISNRSPFYHRLVTPSPPERAEEPLPKDFRALQGKNTAGVEGVGTFTTSARLMATRPLVRQRMVAVKLQILLLPHRYTELTLSDSSEKQISGQACMATKVPTSMKKMKLVFSFSTMMTQVKNTS